MVFALLIVTLTAPPNDWKFVDDANHGGRSVMTYRSVELSETPSRPLHADDNAPSGAKFGSVGLGPGGRQRLAVVWHAPTKSLWFDANGDGRFTTSERHSFGDKPLETNVSIPFDDKTKHERTVLIRQRGDGLAWAVRGEF